MSNARIVFPLTNGSVNVLPVPIPNSSVDPQHINDVANYTAHATQGAVDSAEITSVTLAAGVKSVAIKAWGGASFKGFYYTLNAPDIATAQTRLQSHTGGTSTIRDFAMAGDQTIALSRDGADITSIWFVAIDADGSEDNNGEITPL